MIRTFFIVVWTILVTMVFGVVTILVSFFSKKGNLPHIVARIWAKSILAASFIHVNVVGLSKIDPFKSYIFMSNHQSNFDIPVLLAHLPIQFRWLAKAELFKIPIFGYAMKRAGYISIDRSNRKSAFLSLKKAAQLIRNGVSVIIFPEGTRSSDGTISSFKKGGFVLAVDAGVPIVPVIIHGSRQIMPKNTLSIKSGTVTLQIQDPIETIEFNRKTKDKLLQKVRYVICDSFKKGHEGSS